MKIKYIHFSEPQKEKIFNTQQAYKNMQFAINDTNTKLYKKSQKEFDKMYQEIFAEDKEKGVVLSYEIIEE